MPSYTMSKIDRRTLFKRCDQITKQNWTHSEIKAWLDTLHPENRKQAEQRLQENEDAKRASQPMPEWQSHDLHDEINALNRWSYEGLTERPNARHDETDAERKRAIAQWFDESKR